MNKLEILMQLASMMSDDVSEKPSECTSVAGSMVGEYVIVRSRNEGINAGTVLRADASGVILKDCRRLWYHKPKVKTEGWYEGVANHGLSDDSKVSGAVSIKAILEDYSMTACTETAKQSIETAVSYAKS